MIDELVCPNQHHPFTTKKKLKWLFNSNKNSIPMGGDKALP